VGRRSLITVLEPFSTLLKSFLQNINKAGKRCINLVSILLVETILLLLFTASDFNQTFRVISAPNYSELWLGVFGMILWPQEQKKEFN